MNNRFTHNIRYLFALLFFSFSLQVSGQFNFVYPGPDTFYLDNVCQATLNFGGLPPVVTSTIGANIVTAEVDEILTGFAFGEVVDNIQNPLTVYYNVEDDAIPPNTQTFTFDIYFLDALPPTFATPVPADVVLDCVGDFPPPVDLTAIDNCQLISFPVSPTDNPANPVPNCSGAPINIIRTWTAVDGSGNMTSVSQTITLLPDVQVPNIGTPPSDGIFDCGNADFNAWLADQMMTVENSVTENCTFTVTNDAPADFGDDCGSITVTFTVTDACGLTDTETAVFEVTDNDPPVLNNVPNDTTLSCEEMVPPPPVVSATDNCLMTSVMVDFMETTDQTMNGTCSDFTYTITRTWSAVDDCGNATSATQTITVSDMTPPTFGTPADTTISCEANPHPDFLGYVQGSTDNCTPSNQLVRSYTDEIDTLNCQSNLEITRIWTVTDLCGNVGIDTQYISIVDTVPPTYIAPPDTVFVNCNDVNNINITGSPNNVVENCGIGSFSFVNQFYNQTCVNSYNIRRLWILVDDCGNADTTTQILIVRDTVGPVILQPAQDSTLTCTTDNAANMAFQFWVNSQGFALANDDCSDANVDWFAYNTGTTTTATLPPADCQSNPLGVYRSRTVDFVVRDECGNETLTTATFTVTDNLAPQIVACPDNTTVNTDAGLCEATVGLPPAVASENCGSTPVEMEYSVNGGPRMPMDEISGFIDVFEVGVNNLIYYVRDCGGNEATCAFSVTVLDEEAPEIVCPPSFQVDTDPDVCGATVQLPLPVSTSDNCGTDALFSQTRPTALQDQLMTFTVNPLTGSYVADNKTITFTNVPANTNQDVELRVRVLGDIDEAGEYFQIFDSNGASLGTTEINQPNVSPGDCGEVSIAVFTLPAVYFNSLVNNGMVSFTAVSNTTFTIPVDPGDGINPCNPVNVSQNGDDDGLSFIRMTLNIDFEEFTYYTEGATVIPPTVLTSGTAPEEVLEQGVTNVYFIIEDPSGNADTCSYEVEVIDNEDPNALCQPSLISINPNGFDVAVIDPDSLDMGSTDNCGIDTMYVVNPSITCDMIGDTLTVELIVMDAAGNSDNCFSLVKVEGEVPEPTYYIDDCGSDTLFLFSNPPSAPGPNVWTYSWTGPDNFSSSQANPFIINAGPENAGTYVVTIQGFTDCVASGEIQVAIDDLPVTPVLTFTDNSICEDEDIELNTDPVPSGGMVQYQWYQGVAPNGVLVGSTVVPSFTIPGPHVPGPKTYYVVVVRNGCVSNPSSSKTVQVTAIPIATTNDDELDVCEGGIFSLGTPVVGPGITYMWSGPDGFTSTSQFPPVFNNVTEAKDGIYTLIITNNGCASEPAITIVNILDRPPGPIISNTTSQFNPACVGDSIILVTNVTGGTSYEWTGGPLLTTFVTDTNFLVINNATVGLHSGNWKVVVYDNVCPSEPSDPGTTVYIENLPLIDASSNSPVCDNETLQLTSNFINGASFQWTGPTGTMYSGSQPNPITNPPAGMYTLEVTSANLCKNTDTITVTVNEAPEVVSVSNNAPPCPEGPTNVQLFHTVFPEDDGSYTYLWTNNAGYLSNQPNAVIPGATESDNGPYILTITNGVGCTSDPEETIVDLGSILPAPPTPVLNQANPFCEGENVMLSVTDIYSGVDETFNWITPNGDVLPETSPFITLNNLDVIDGGLYQVVVEVDGCVTDTSSAVQLIVNPIPEVEAISNSPVCEGDIIQLGFSDCFSGQNVQYEWAGPGISSSICNPIIGPATTNNTGSYVGTVTVNGCESAPVSASVIVNASPGVPVISNSGAVCLNDSEAELTLFIQPGSATPGATYSWFSNGLSIGTSGGGLVFTINDFSNLTPGLNTITAVAELNTCNSAPSVPTSVQLDTVPANNSDAGVDVFTCEGEAATLLAVPPTTGTGIWSMVIGNPNGVTISNPSAPTTTVQGLQEGQIYSFAWTLSNGACTSYSVDTTQVTVDIIEDADAGPDVDTCEVTSVQLSAGQPEFGQGVWSQPPAQETLMVVIENPFDLNTTVSGLVPGNEYIFFWTLLDNGCGEDQDVMFVRVLNGDSFSGGDYQDCGDGCTELDAVQPTTGFGTWTSPNPAITFTDPNDPMAVACNLIPGDNELIWTINDGLCGLSGSDTLTVEYTLQPEAMDDTVSVDFAGTLEIQVDLNDTKPDNYFVELLTEPSNGTVGELSEGTFSYQANVNFVGTDFFDYQICSDICECSTGRVWIEVGGEAKCTIPTIITPNNDGVNDAFVIPCLAEGSAFPNNEVSIFNQWGDEVFRAAPYLNNWGGTYAGEDLPPGTYFFIVKLGEGEAPQSGFLIIQR